MNQLQTVPHRRKNLLTGEWILVSPHRAGRPWQGKTSQFAKPTQPAHDSGCYLCPGNMRANGIQNPVYSSSWVFTNDFPALTRESISEVEDKNPLLVTFPATGTSRVICFSPDHSKTLPRLSLSEIRSVISSWINEFAELKNQFLWVQIFENKGELMGCSNPHPHGQIWATSFLPAEAEKEDLHQKDYFEKTGNCLLSDYLKEELKKGDRIVSQNDDWVFLVPFWAAWPFETLLLPKRKISQLDELTETEQESLAEILKLQLTGFDRLFDIDFPYSMGWHGAPSNGKDKDHWLLHAHFFPPLLRSATVQKFMVGFEMLAERQRDITPERSADLLKVATYLESQD